LIHPEAAKGQKSRALTIPEIKEIVQEYRNSAKWAKVAGFDGIEIHAGRLND
jgi:2,4-dienoyl-CoA reductase-like NADH-dependent reductase (Old Yellow Enzyme family)